MPVRLAEARSIMDLAGNEYMGLPFCKRWLTERGFSPFKISFAVKQLEVLDAIRGYPVLKERSGMAVAQAEHTIIVKDKPLVITL